MTNEEAIKVLKDMIPKTCKMVNGRYVGGFEDTECPQFEAVQVVVEALEKQIPKKPYLDNDNGIYQKEYCPTCHRSLFPNDHHCKCGQALDWSDTE